MLGCNLLLGEETIRDRSPIRNNRPRANLRPRGRGRGRMRGRVGGQRVVDPNIAWNQTYNLPRDRPFAEPSPGPRNRYPQGSETPAGLFFEEMFTDEMWDLIAAETNRYHEQQSTAEPNKHKTKWTPVCKDEIKTFIGIIIFMGIVKLPRIAMYWSSDALCHQQTVSNLMPYIRFFQIWRYFHLADNTTALPRDNSNFDKIYRVREFLDLVMRNAQNLYRLHRDLSIDETMVPHKGRLSYKQYIKNKPVRWGIKLWVLCEAKTGFVYKFQVYLGKEGGVAEQHLARRVVKHLMEPLEGKYHHVYMDNFYSDPHLFLELETKKILSCGTIRSNRKGFPNDIVITKAMEKRMNRGDYLWRCHGNLVAISWYDRRPVYIISTIHPPDNNGAPCSVLRRSRGGPREEIPCPPAQLDYQDYMGGVDLADQISTSFSVIRKSKKAWKKLFYYGLEVCLLNSFIVHKSVVEKPLDFLHYRLAIVRYLTEGQCFRKKAGRPPSRPLTDADSRRLNGQYHSIAVEDKRRYCVVCAKYASIEGLSTNSISKTNTVCTTCDRKPLCVLAKRNCWQKWHTLREYWHR